MTAQVGDTTLVHRETALTPPIEKLVAEIEALAAKATKGPWHVGGLKRPFDRDIIGPGGEDIGFVNYGDGADEPTSYPFEANAALIIALANAWPTLSRALTERAASLPDGIEKLSNDTATMPPGYSAPLEQRTTAELRFADARARLHGKNLDGTDRRETITIPEGMKLVPVEPTAEMLAAFLNGFKTQLRARHKARFSDQELISAEEAGLRAMLASAASPAAPSVGGTAVLVEQFNAPDPAWMPRGEIQSSDGGVEGHAATPSGSADRDGMQTCDGRIVKGAGIKPGTSESTTQDADVLNGARAGKYTEGPNKSGYYTAGIDMPLPFDPHWHLHAIEFHSKEKAVAEARRDVVLAAMTTQDAEPVRMVLNDPAANKAVAEKLTELHERAAKQPVSYIHMFREAFDLAEQQFKRAMRAEAIHPPSAPTVDRKALGALIDLQAHVMIPQEGDLVNERIIGYRSGVAKCVEVLRAITALRNGGAK